MRTKTVAVEVSLVSWLQFDEDDEAARVSFNGDSRGNGGRADCGSTVESKFSLELMKQLKFCPQSFFHSHGEKQSVARFSSLPSLKQANGSLLFPVQLRPRHRRRRRRVDLTKICCFFLAPRLQQY